VLEGTQLVALEVERVVLFVPLPVATVVNVKLEEPLGLLMVTTEFEGKALYSAAARLAVVELPL